MTSSSLSPLRRTSLLALAATLTLAGCGNGAGSEDGGRSDYSGQTVRVIVPTAAGGGFDTTIRQLQPALESELDTTLAVENMEGAATAIGTQAAASADGDCMTLMMHGVPHLNFSYLTQDVDYALDAFAPVGGISIEPGVIRVHNDAPWQTFEELIDDARERPEEISMSVSLRTSSNYVGMLGIQEATGAEFNIISYDGGGPARNALVAGEVDATHAGVFNSQSIADDTRVLAVQQDENTWAEETDDAPTVGEALGTEVEPNSSNYTLWVPAGCAEEFPQRYQALVDALPTALENADYQADLEEVGEQNKVDYLTDEEALQLAEDNEARIQQVLDDDPDAFIEE